jgi:hypothetical protein
MNPKEFRFIRQSAVLALAGSLSAVSSMSQQSGPPAAATDCARAGKRRRCLRRDSVLPDLLGWISTGVAERDVHDDYGQLARYTRRMRSC